MSSTAPPSNTLSRPAGTALFIEADRRTILVRRRIKHHCTREEWDSASGRAAAIAACWQLTFATIGAEGETFFAPWPVTLYRDPITGEVVAADIQLPQDGGPRWIDSRGRPLLAAPVLFGLRRERTTYMEWAEGPLPYLGDHEALLAPDPLADRQLQQIRHQNAALRERIDAAIAPSFDPIAQDAGHDEYVDFRVRGIFSRLDLRVLGSAQTGEAAKLLTGDGVTEIRDIDPADRTDGQEEA